MNKHVSPLFIGLLIILIAEVLNLDAKTDFIIKSAMLGIIGMSYFIAGFKETKNINKVIFIICGVFLMLKNFITQSSLLTFISVVSVVVPVYLNYLSKRNIEKNKGTLEDKK